MKQSSIAIIGVIIVIIVIAVAALSLSGQNSNPNATYTAESTNISVSNQTTAVTSATNVTNSTTNMTNSSKNVTNSSSMTNSSNATAKVYNLMVGSNAVIGNYLENSLGYTLYLLNSDKQYNASTCTGTCAVYWPPYTYNGSISSLSVQGINASALGTITRSDGSKQLTYDGWPLYLFHKDTAAGQISGNGISAFGGTWYAVTVPNATTT